MPKLYKNRYRINSARLVQWNYASKGYYFITICTHRRTHSFATMENDQLHLTEAGLIAKILLNEIHLKFPHIAVVNSAILPDHIHLLLEIDTNSTPVSPPTNAGGITSEHNPMITHHTISAAMRYYKARVTFEIHKNTPQKSFRWLARFYDEIVRDEKMYHAVTHYIDENPQKWIDNHRPNTP